AGSAAATAAPAVAWRNFSKKLWRCGTAPKDPLATGRFRFLRRQATELFGTAPAALYCSGQADSLGETRRPARGAMDDAGRRLCRGRVSAETTRLERGASF